MTPFFHRALRLAPLHLGLVLAAAAPAAAQAADVRQVGQAVEWRGFLEPTPIPALSAVAFTARGVVGTESERLVGLLSIGGNTGSLVATGSFGPFAGERVRVALLDGDVPLAEVTVQARQPLALGAAAPAAAASDPLRTTAPVSLQGDVTIFLEEFPGGFGSVSFALFQRAGFASAGGEVVPAPMWEIDLGVPATVVVRGQAWQASKIRFLAERPFPPPGSPSAILQRVEIVSGSILGGSPGPSIELVAELADPGVLFSGVPVSPDEGGFGIDFDASRETIEGVDFGAENGPVRLVTGDAAGVAATWESRDLAGQPAGVSVELAAIGRNIAGVEVRGVVTALATDDGWDLRFQPPGGQAGIPRTVEVDGEPVGQVTVPAPAGVFARATEPPSGAEVFPMGLGEGAFYGFTWDAPVAIEVSGAGTFTGSEVRLVFPQPIGPLAFGGIIVEELLQLTLTGLAAPAVADGGPCIATATRLCLAGGRFAVEVAWADPFGGAGPGVAIPLTQDTGTFWFFKPANLELMVKVLDACPVFDHFWVFAGGLTNVEVELTVTDTRTGAEQVYRNPQGQAFQPIQDTAAFLCTP
ncbi:MAG TPA: hypothetical protein VF100_04005 [Thermoanaerobaculia bacterium]